LHVRYFGIASFYADLQNELEELAKTANPILDLQMMEYWDHHPPVVASKA
jgi:hypothetical protein